MISRRASLATPQTSHAPQQHHQHECLDEWDIHCHRPSYLPSAGKAVRQPTIMSR
jgi:hypothetical protein